MKKKTLEALGRVDVDNFKRQPKTPVILVLDNVRSGLNVGAAFRTADGFALERICLCGITAQPPHREILKTAIGATESVEWAYYEKTEDAISQLKAKGCHVWAIEQAEGSVPLQDFHPTKGESYALVFGNEVAGVDAAALTLVDGCLEIPQFGTKHSLNVSVCIGIVAWEFWRKLC